MYIGHLCCRLFRNKGLNKNVLIHKVHGRSAQKHVLTSLFLYLLEIALAKVMWPFQMYFFPGDNRSITSKYDLSCLFAGEAKSFTRQITPCRISHSWVTARKCGKSPNTVDRGQFNLISLNTDQDFQIKIINFDGKLMAVAFSLFISL